MRPSHGVQEHPCKEPPLDNDRLFLHGRHSPCQQRHCSATEGHLQAAAGGEGQPCGNQSGLTYPLLPHKHKPFHISRLFFSIKSILFQFTYHLLLH